jgi:CubicO group peptidase (beta-lactamase class C family)
MQADRQTGKASMKNIQLSLSVFAVVFCFEAFAQNDHLVGLDAFVAESMAATGVPGVAVSVVYGDDVILARGFGVLESGKPERVDEDTLFAIGSNSKHFTATLLGILVAEGKLDWDEPMTRYLPQLRFSDPVLFKELTLLDALSHRTGLQRADLAWYARPGISREDTLAMIESLQLEIPFRSGFIYNNFMFVAAGEVIPAVAGVSWNEFIADRIFAPLRMERSNTSIHGLNELGNVAMPHVMKGGEAIPIDYYDLDHMTSAGSINSSASDMAQWCRLQLGNGMLGDTRVIPEQVLNDVRQPHSFLPQNDDGHIGTTHSTYALGIQRANYGANVAYLHTGGIDGMVSSFVLVPEQQLCVTVLTNGSPPYGLHAEIPTWILDRLLGLENDYDLQEFNKDIQEQLEEEAEIQQQHDQVHDESAPFSLPLEAYAGTYADDTFGALTVAHTDGVLRLQYGARYTGDLQHHRNDSFDLIHDVAVQNYTEPTVLSFALNANGEVESVLLQIIGEEAAEVRFLVVSIDESANDAG